MMPPTILSLCDSFLDAAIEAYLREAGNVLFAFCDDTRETTVGDGHG